MTSGLFGEDFASSTPGPGSDESLSVERMKECGSNIFCRPEGIVFGPPPPAKENERDGVISLDLYKC